MLGANLHRLHPGERGGGFLEHHAAVDADAAHRRRLPLHRHVEIQRHPFDVVRLAVGRTAGAIEQRERIGVRRGRTPAAGADGRCRQLAVARARGGSVAAVVELHFQLVDLAIELRRFDRDAPVGSDQLRHDRTS